MTITLKQLLTQVSTGQMIRVIILDADWEETGETVEFENDHIDLGKSRVRKILNLEVAMISSTEDDFLRVEVMLWKK